MKPLMQFQSAKSHIHCLVHTLNRMVCDILVELKSRTMREAQDDKDDANIAGPITKLQHIVVLLLLIKFNVHIEPIGYDGHAYCCIDRSEPSTR
jgi:hypothetical protein